MNHVRRDSSMSWHGRSAGCLGLVVSLFTVSPGTSLCQRGPVPLQRILTDSTLWGKDFPAVLANLPAWRDIGESTIAVFPDRVLGGTPYPTRDDAQPMISRLQEALGRPRGTPQPDFAALLDAALKTPPPFETTVALFGEDHSARIAWTGPILRLLTESLTVARLQERLGAPETVTQRLIQTDRDNRPAVLTMRSYAGGSVVFTESDRTPRPGIIDRVVFDTRVLSAALFRGGGQ